MVSADEKGFLLSFDIRYDGKLLKSFVLFTNNVILRSEYRKKLFLFFLPDFERSRLVKTLFYLTRSL